MTSRGKDFADLVHRLLIMDQVRTVDQVARAMGMEYHTFHARISGRVVFSADEIRALIHLVHDRRLLGYFTDEAPYVLVDRRDVDASVPSGDGLDILLKSAHATVVEAADILEVTAEALADRRVDHQEAARILREVEHCEQALATIRHILGRKSAAKP